MATTTLKQLLNKIELFCTNHGQIKSFGTGSYFKIDTTHRDYPLLWVTPQPSYIKGNSVELSLTIMVADILDGEESNLVDVWSDALSIAEDFVSYFSTWTGYYDEGLRLDESSVYVEPFYHVLDNEVAGYFMKVLFIIPIPQNYCDIPQK